MSEDNSTLVLEENPSPLESTNTSSVQTLGVGLLTPEISTYEDAQTLFTWYKLKVPAHLNSNLTPRVGHALIFSTKTRKVYMIGGGNHSGDIKEVWEFEYPSKSSPFTGVLNQKLSAEFPGMYEFSCSYDGSWQSTRELVWIFGGADIVENKNDVHVLDLSEECFTKYYLGSQDKDELNNMSASGGGDNVVPAPRTQGNNSCFLVIKGEEYLAAFGGGQRGEKAIPDGHLYLFHIKNKIWKRVEVAGDTPPPSQGHAMASIDTKIYLHGGMDDFIFFGELYVIELNNERPAWAKLSMVGPQPCPRAAHGMIALHKCLYVCCGVCDDGALTDVWKFHTEVKEWVCLNEPAQDISMAPGQFPSPRTDFAITTLNVSNETDGEVNERNMLLIHGGMNTQGILFQDFWLFPLTN